MSTRPPPAEAIAEKILENFAGPYYVTSNTAHAARARIIRDAAKSIAPELAEVGKTAAPGCWNAS